jgi:hypothetical protein
MSWKITTDTVNEDYYFIVSGNIRGRFINGELIRGTLLPQNKRDYN